MSDTQPVANGSRWPAFLAVGAVAVAVGLLVGLRLVPQEQSSESPATTGQSTPVAATAATSAPPSDEPSAEPSGSAVPSAPPTLPSTTPRPTRGLTSIAVFTAEEFERLLVSGRYVGETLLVQGRLVATDTPGNQPADGQYCDGERWCVYGQLEGASVNGGTRPLVVWSREIATPLGPDDRRDEFWWPSRERVPLPVEGILVLRIDTTYSVEYIGRALIDDLGPVLAPESVAAMEIESLGLDTVVVTDASLTGEVGTPCPEADFDPPLPSSDCGDPGWIFRQEAPIFAYGPNVVPVQNGAYPMYASRPGPSADGRYEPQRGLWVLGPRLQAGGECATDACPAWHLLGPPLSTHIDPEMVADLPEPPPVDDRGWVEVGDARSLAAAWSPDGRWLLVTEAHEVFVVDAQTGERVRAWEFESDRYNGGAVWIDEHRFLAIRSQPGDMIDDEMALAAIGRVDTAVLAGAEVPFGYESDAPWVSALPGGLSAVAFETTDDRSYDCVSDPCWTYRIWTPDGLSRERFGKPITWSASGELLAVIRNDGDRADSQREGLGAGFGGYQGWLEIVRWPGLKTVFSNRSLVVHEDAKIDPAGRRLATAVWPPAWLDLSNGRVHEMDTSETFFGQVWDTSSRLFGVDQDGNVVAGNLDGEIDQAWPGAGHNIIGAADGSRQVGWLQDPSRGAPFGVFTVINSETLPRTFALPPQPIDDFLFEPSISSNGSALIAWVIEHASGDGRLMLHPLD